ncbi:hypothetical protein D3C71_20110 [compost metagenome]
MPIGHKSFVEALSQSGSSSSSSNGRQRARPAQSEESESSQSRRGSSEGMSSGSVESFKVGSAPAFDAHAFSSQMEQAAVAVPLAAAELRWAQANSDNVAQAVSVLSMREQTPAVAAATDALLSSESNQHLARETLTPHGRFSDSSVVFADGSSISHSASAAMGPESTTTRYYNPGEAQASASTQHSSEISYGGGSAAMNGAGVSGFESASNSGASTNYDLGGSTYVSRPEKVGSGVSSFAVGDAPGIDMQVYHDSMNRAAAENPQLASVLTEARMHSSNLAEAVSYLAAREQTPDVVQASAALQYLDGNQHTSMEARGPQGHTLEHATRYADGSSASVSQHQVNDMSTRSASISGAESLAADHAFASQLTEAAFRNHADQTAANIISGRSIDGSNVSVQQAQTLSQDLRGLAAVAPLNEQVHTLQGVASSEGYSSSTTQAIREVGDSASAYAREVSSMGVDRGVSESASAGYSEVASIVQSASRSSGTFLDVREQLQDLREQLRDPGSAAQALTEVRELAGQARDQLDSVGASPELSAKFEALSSLSAKTGPAQVAHYLDNHLMPSLQQEESTAVRGSVNLVREALPDLTAARDSANAQVSESYERVAASMGEAQGDISTSLTSLGQQMRSESQMEEFSRTIQAADRLSDPTYNSQLEGVRQALGDHVSGSSQLSLAREVTPEVASYVERADIKYEDMDSLLKDLQAESSSKGQKMDLSALEVLTGMQRTSDESSRVSQEGDSRRQEETKVAEAAAAEEMSMSE